MDDFPGTSEDGNFDRDSLSDESLSRDSLLDEKVKQIHKEETQVRRKGSYTIEISPEMSESLKIHKLKLPIFVKTDNSHHSYASDKISDIDMKVGNNVPSKNMMTQSMYERPWSSAKRNNSIVSAIAKQREEKLRLVKEEQMKKQQQKVFGLSENQKQAEIARKRKEEEIQKKVDDKRLKALERHRIVEERKQRLAQAEEARKSRILRKMTNQEEKHNSPQASINMMTMSCYGALGSAKSRHGNKEVVRDRFTGKRPISSTGKVIGFGSSSPRSICENPLKTTPKHPPKISEYLMERSQILSRPASSRISDKMTTSVMTPSPTIASSRPMARQGSLREKRPLSAMISSTMVEKEKTKSIKKLKSISNKVDSTDGKSNNSSNSPRNTSRKTNLTKPNTPDHTRSIRERPASAKPVQHTNPIERGIVQSKSSTFPKAKRLQKSNRGKVDVHLDSDSIEDEGLTLTESFNHPKSVTSSSISHLKSEINRTDLSSADSLEAEHSKEKHFSTEYSENSKTVNTENSNCKMNASGRALPTKDLSEVEYKARLMENRRLIREKRERERDQLMKAERERRHVEEATVREIMELEKPNPINFEDNNLTTSNDDALDDQTNIIKVNESVDEVKTVEQSISVEITPTDQSSESSKDLENEERERLERKKRLESIMSRLKKTNEESSSEGGGVSPRRAMSPELAELDTEVAPVSSNPMFRSSLLQSMLNKGKLSGKNSTPPNRDPEEIKSSQEDVTMIHNTNQQTGILALTSLRESVEDSESQPINLNSKSSVAVRSSGIDGNSLSDANSDFVVDQENHSNSSATNNENCNNDRGDCDGQEDFASANLDPVNGDDQKSDVLNTVDGVNKYSSASSIETEEDEIIKNSFTKDHLYNSHIIRPLAQEGCVFQS